MINRLFTQLRNTLNDVSFMCTHRTKSTYFTRSTCMLDFKILMAFILKLPKGAMQIELNQFLKNFLPNLHKMRAESLQKARLKIEISAFTDLIQDALETIYKSPFKNFRGYRVVAVDGSVFEVPTQAEKEFGTLNVAGKSIAKAQVCALCDVLNNIILEADIAPYETSERKQAAELITRLEEKSQNQDIENLYLFDRGFPSRELIRVLGMHPYIFRVSKAFLLPIRKANQEDQIVTITDDKGEEHRIRVVNLKLPSGMTEKLFSNIIDESVTIEDFKNLYNKRWGIETRYRILKSNLEIDNFSSTNRQIIEQDFYATIFIANLLAVVQNYADEEIRKENTDRKYEYKTNTNVAIPELKAMLLDVVMSKNPFKKIYVMRKLLNEVKKYILPVRDKRAGTPRKIKYYLVKHPFNKKGNH